VSLPHTFWGTSNDSVRFATELFLILEGFEKRTAGTIADAQVLSDMVHSSN
jgi:hypothetical protein